MSRFKQFTVFKEKLKYVSTSLLQVIIRIIKIILKHIRVLYERYSQNLSACYLGHSHTEREKDKDKLYHILVLQKHLLCGIQRVGAFVNKNAGNRFLLSYVIMSFSDIYIYSIFQGVQYVLLILFRNICRHLILKVNYFRQEQYRCEVPLNVLLANMKEDFQETLWSAG